MDARREEDDEINDFERAPLGEGEDERVSSDLSSLFSSSQSSRKPDHELHFVLIWFLQQYNKRLTVLLDRDRDDMRVLDEIRSGGGGEEEREDSPVLPAKGKKGKKKKLTIEEVSRWTMV